MVNYYEVKMKRLLLEVKLPYYRIAIWLLLGCWILVGSTTNLLADEPDLAVNYVTITARTTLIGPPTNFIITQVGPGSVNVSWTKNINANTTIIRVTEDGCPANYLDNYLVYNDTGNWTIYDSLSLTTSTYCFRAWSYNDDEYSIDYAEGKIGGDSMILIGFIILPLGLMTLALWQKKIWLMLGAGISFICLAAYGLIDGSPGEAIWILGIFCIIFSFIVFLYAFFGMREPVEVIPFEEPDNAYAREIREAKEARRKDRRTPRRRM